jgi:hypothetical protein
VERLGAYNVARAIGVRAPEIKIRMKKEAEDAAKRVKEEKEGAAKLYKRYKADIKANEEKLQEEIAAVKKGVKREFKALYKGTSKEVSSKDVDQVARLVGQGIAITAAEHDHLKKHVMDQTYLDIKENLEVQAFDGDINPCTGCDILNYLKHV